MDINSLLRHLLGKDNFELVDVTPEIQSLIDYDGAAAARIRSLRTEGPFTSQPYLTTKLTREEWLAEWVGYIRRFVQAGKLGTHREFCEYDLHFVDKYGPQGGNFSSTRFEELYLPFFQNAHRTRTYRVALRGRDYLLARIRARVELVGYPQPAAGARLATNGALPTSRRKGDFFAETCYNMFPRHVMPDLPGQRRQRNRIRVINQDSCSNVRYWEETFNGIRNWLKTNFPEYFSSWLNPDEYERPAVFRWLSCPDGFSIEADYEHCDEQYSLETVQVLIYPILEALIPDNMMCNYLFAYIEEMFHQPIYLGDKIMCGLHNLLSGQVFTNDFETYYDVCLDIGTWLEARDRGICDNITILARGDDQALLMRGSEEQARAVSEIQIEEANLNGMLINLEKSSITHRSVRYCKTMYYPRMPRMNADYTGYVGAYPTVLALNNVINPERNIADDLEFIRALCQRVDNCCGTVYYQPFQDYIASRLKKPSWNVRTTYDALDTMPVYDWYERVFGQRWLSRDSGMLRTLIRHNYVRIDN